MRLRVNKRKIGNVILDALGESISIIDEHLRIVWVNAVVEKWAGELKEISGKNCYRVYQKRDDPCENCPTIKAFKTGRVERARHYAYDIRGDIKYLELISSPLRDKSNRITTVVELAVDLTEKVQLEYMLTEAKNSLQTIFDNIDDGLSVIDKDHQILRVNLGILKMFGRKAFSDLIGRKCFAEYYKEDNVCKNCPAQRTFEDGKAHHTPKVCYEGNNGRIILDTFTFPIKDEHDKVTQVIECIKNITGTVKVEDQLLYQERLAGIGEFATGIAHEIRNPLANITASAQFCLTKYRLHELAKKHLRIILRNSEHANSIIKDLLDFARPGEICFKPGHIIELMDGICNLVKTRCSKQKVRLTKRCSKRLPPIVMDRKRLEQAFLNFVSNSLDAMPNGGRLAITAYPDSQNSEVVVCFSDTGTGIPQEHSDKIFNPFFTTKEHGIGLGLCLAHQIVCDHKGRISLASTEGQGTEIIVRLPISRE